MTPPFWSAAFLAFVLPLTAEQVFVSASLTVGGATPASREEWRWINLAQRLTWQYGEAEALTRLNAYPLPMREAARIRGRAA